MLLEGQKNGRNNLIEKKQGQKMTKRFVREIISEKKKRKREK